MYALAAVNIVRLFGECGRSSLSGYREVLRSTPLLIESTPSTQSILRLDCRTFENLFRHLSLL